MTSGIRWLARNQPNDVCELTLTVQADIGSARDGARTVLAEHGELVDAGDARSGTHWLQAVVHLGIGNMDRAVVTLTLQERSVVLTQIDVRGMSKEALIKRYISHKSTHLIADALREAFPTAD